MQGKKKAQLPPLESKPSTEVEAITQIILLKGHFKRDPAA
jgi:hypothetical protein